MRSRPVWDRDEDMAADLGDAQAVLYVGVAGSGAVGLWDGLHALDPPCGCSAPTASRPWLARG